MSFYISKSGFTSAYNTCNKHAWLDAHMPDQKKPVDDFAQSLFDNGHLIGELAKEHFCVEVDVTVTKENGSPNMAEMLRETEKHMKLGTKVLAEASFRYNGCFCSVDILVRNADGTYDMFEVNSSKQDKPTKKNPLGVDDKYLIDVAYQRYVLEHCGVPLRRGCIVMLNPNYIRSKTLDLSQYFVTIDVTAETAAKQTEVAAKLADLDPVMNDPTEPASVICAKCNDCEYFGYCGRNIPTPSVFDVYSLRFPKKIKYYQDGISFFNLPQVKTDLPAVAKLQIEYYNRPNDAYIDKTAIREFLNSLTFPLHSLDFETYQAIVPEYEGMSSKEAVPFQYSLHIMKKPDGDYTEGSPDLEERHFLDMSGGDPRRAIAESLVQNIPYGACVIAWHQSTESGIIKRLADVFPDLKDHLMSFTYRDPLKIFQDGAYYVKAMGGSCSIKSIAPALYPDDPGMNYHNLEGDIKNGGQAMNAIQMSKSMIPEGVERLRQSLLEYCALDTMAVVKILKKLYEVSK